MMTVTAVPKDEQRSVIQFSMSKDAQRSVIQFLTQEKVSGSEICTRMCMFMVRRMLSQNQL